MKQPDGDTGAEYQAVLQWLEEAGEHGPRVVATKRLNQIADNCYSLVEPRLTIRTGKWFLTLGGSSEPLTQPTQGIEVALGPPGQLTLIKPCAAAF